MRQPWLSSTLAILNTTLTSLFLSSMLDASAATALCSATNKCPQSAPCCSSAGYCGSTGPYCLAECNPLGSLSPSSCAPMPACRDATIDFTDGGTHWTPLATYKGDASVAPLTLDSGDVKVVRGQGAKLLLTKKNQDVGTVLSTTRYMYYGSVTATLQHPNRRGVVAAFILMSPTADEIDYELTTGSPSHVETNAFYRGTTNGDHNSVTLPLSAEGFDTSDFHDYTISWTPSTIIWSIDGKTKRSFARSSHRSKLKSFYKYPATPARIQLSIWCAGCPGNAQGTRQWSGGALDWSRADSKDEAFEVTVKKLAISCDTPSKLLGAKAFAYSSSRTDARSGEPSIISSDRPTTVG